MPRLNPISLLLLSLPLSSTLPSSPATLSRRDNCTLPSPQCGCTRTSFSPWSWSLSDLYFHSSVIFSTPAHQIDGGFVSFSLSHPAVPDVAFDCQASSTQLQDWFYGDQWYTCTGKEIEAGEGEGEGKGSDDGGVKGTTAQFRFDRVTGRVDVNQSWVCREDPVYP
jgi:hypothetical protein